MANDLASLAPTNFPTLAKDNKGFRIILGCGSFIDWPRLYLSPLFGKSGLMVGLGGFLHGDQA